MAKFHIQPHVRLQEWVADEKGFFAEEGLDYEFETAGFAGGGSGADATVQSADAAPLAVRSGALEDMEQGRACAVSGACHWAVNAAASASHGKMWGAAYSVCTSGIFVAPESPYETLMTSRTSRSASDFTPAATTRRFKVSSPSCSAIRSSSRSWAGRSTGCG
ncbi:MAG: hypothetical protein ACXVUL_09440 [Solirubrobacteraceae bacterium]